jgi:cytosine/creatinine deaminase
MTASERDDYVSADRNFMVDALNEAKRGYRAGGIPIGSVLVRAGKIIAAGHNQRVQKSDPIAHGEMDCLKNAGRQRSYKDTIIYTTLSPCMMCAGTILQFQIPRVVIGENQTFGGNEDLLRSRGVEVVVLDDEECKALMARFIKAHPDIWQEDIGD